MYHARRSELEPPRRVMVVGSPGAEKGALARAIAQRLRLPLIELETVYWRPGWVRPDAETWRRQMSELAARDEWVMEGTFPSTLDIRVARADWFVFVDAPMLVCFARKFREMMRSEGGKRPEVAPGCPRRFDARLLRFIWSFPTSTAHELSSIIARERRNRTIFILRSKREQEEFLAKVPTLGSLES